MATAMATTTVETATAMIAASTVELTAAVEIATAAIAVAAVELAAAVAAIETAFIAAATVVAVFATTIVSTAVAVSATVVAAPVPGAGADEDASSEPVRAVVAVGSAGVRIIVVVAVSADWRGAIVGGSADTNAEGYALGVGVGGGEKTNGESNSE
jgi:hypothetical protein